MGSFQITIPVQLRLLSIVASSALLMECGHDSGLESPQTGGASATSVMGGATAIGGSPSAGGAMSAGGASTSSAMTGGATATGASGGASATGVGGVTAAGGMHTGVGGVTGVAGGSTTGGANAFDGGTDDDAGYLEDGGESPSFTMIYNDIISVRCIGCHGSGGAGITSGKLDMSTKALAYADLVGSSGMGVAAAGTQCGTSGLLRVTPGEHATSLLWQKVDTKLKGVNAPCGNPMPVGSPATTLSQAQVDAIAEWIDSGALDD